MQSRGRNDPQDQPWWRGAVVYQVYPRSFQDTDGDGVGDLRGISERLPYLAALPIDAIWISPIFPSPMLDFGYDIADYCGVDPIFGSLEDFDRLVAEAHERGLKILLDLVPSHTSDRHPWFRASRRSRDDPKRNWYVWSDPGPGGGLPNNWISEFGGPAWTWDDATGQYYLNIYLSEQPALNWRNPDVHRAMADVMRFWFRRGVDGFRVDAVEHLAPDAELRDNPLNPQWREHEGPARSHLRTFTAHQPDGYMAAKEMRRVADEFPDRVLLGEAYGTLTEVVGYYGDALDGFHLPFNFELVSAPWDARHIADFAAAYEAALPPGAWPTWVLGNHDRSRIASRIGASQARVAMMLLLTLRGTPTIYQGDELGLTDSVIPPDLVQDPWEKRVPGQGLGRDPVRTPMPWSDAPQSGFTSGQPWLPIPHDTTVDAQEREPGSMLDLTRRLLALRRGEPAIRIGAYESVELADGVLAFRRRHGQRAVTVALNLAPCSRPVALEGRVLLSTRPDRSDGAFDGRLLPDEGVIVASA
jgi:alpha-glucosidase